MLADQDRPYTFELGRFWVSFRSQIAGLERNPELILNLGVFFRQVPAGTAVRLVPDSTTGPTVSAISWPNADKWQRYKRVILSTSQRYWSGKFWLLPPASCWRLCSFKDDRPLERNVAAHRAFPTYAQSGASGEPCKGLYSFNVYCRTNIYEAPNPAHAHITFDCPYLGDTDDGAFINYADAAGSGSGRLSSAVRQPRQLDGAAHIDGRTAHSHYQRQYIHEIGHALGQRHIGYYVNDPLCAETPSHSPGASHDHCYTGNSEADERNIMGAGERLTSVNAAPWKAVMATLTATTPDAWGTSMQRVFPRFIGISRVRPT